MTEAALIAEMMKNWNTIRAAVVAANPTATAEEVQRMTSEAMNRAIAALVALIR